VAEEAVALGVALAEEVVVAAEGEEEEEVVVVVVVVAVLAGEEVVALEVVPEAQALGLTDYSIALAELGEDFPAGCQGAVTVTTDWILKRQTMEIASTLMKMVVWVLTVEKVMALLLPALPYQLLVSLPLLLAPSLSLLPLRPF
jgi:hypothetical protein